ncbi:hypothetical protein WJX75_005169 [Coccomyxa subellipsoidea]|uniref:Uncharacterized protein n=1 Tax=Coccomyxa subellipsoidea TaxID=248742 RepID=A0ABR2YJN2_9CHLO
MLRQALKEKDIFENIIETLVAAQSDFEEDEEIYTDTEEEEADTKSYQGQAFASTYLQRQEESITTEQLASRVPAIDDGSRDAEFKESKAAHHHAEEELTDLETRSSSEVAGQLPLQNGRLQLIKIG